MMQSTEQKSTQIKAQRGLTLFELLIVLGILALLATMIAPRVIGYLGRAKSDVAKSQLSNIATAMELYYYDVGAYPTTDMTLTALVTKPENAASWRGPYLKEATGLIDPWGKEYLFTVEPGTDSFVLFTYGRDGVEGGDGEDADLQKR